MSGYAGWTPTGVEKQFNSETDLKTFLADTYLAFLRSEATTRWFRSYSEGLVAKEYE